MKCHSIIFSIIQKHKQVPRCCPHRTQPHPLPFPPLPSLSTRWPPLSCFACHSLGWVARNVSVPPLIVFASGRPTRRGSGGAHTVCAECAGDLHVQPALVYFGEFISVFFVLLCTKSTDTAIGDSGMPLSGSDDTC